MAYTTINKATDYFNTKLYTGNGSNNTAITGVGFQPDFVWIKNKETDTYEHHLMDVIRGWGTGSSDTPNITSNNNAAEYDRNIFSSTGVTADGFNLNNYSDTNENGHDFVAWNWKANGAGSSNTDGSITSTVSANTTSGFSIVKYTGTGANATIGHGLGSAPACIITKRLDTSNNWGVGHDGLHATVAWEKYIEINNTNIVEDHIGQWQDTAPTNSVFYVGDSNSSNASGDGMIAYCFANKTGYSKFGSYTGNGSTDGAFIYTGFKPAWVMIKRTDATSRWRMYDNKINPFNVADTRLSAESSDAENTGTANAIDMISQGFKIRTSESQLNASGGNFIYMAFGQSLVGSNNIPCTAR